MADKTNTMGMTGVENRTNEKFEAGAKEFARCWPSERVCKTIDYMEQKRIAEAAFVKRYGYSYYN